MKTRTWFKRAILYYRAEDSFLAATIWKSLPGYIWIYTNRHKKEWVYTSWEKVSEDFIWNCDAEEGWENYLYGLE